MPAQRYQVGRGQLSMVSLLLEGITYARKFHDLALKETTVRRLKNTYQAFLKLENVPVPDEQSSAQDSPEILEFPPKKTGCLLLLCEELDQQVRHYLT